MQFDQMGLIAPILKALQEEGYTQPTPIQAQAIAPLLQKRDLLGCAQTGTGKTAAFALPILQNLHLQQMPGAGRRPIRALILTPTRELAIQIEESLKAYGRHLPLRHLVIFGGVGQHPQVKGLQYGVDVLVATPGRLLDLMGQGYVHLEQLEIFVLDEADRMLDMGFVHDVKKVIAKLPAKRQTLFFSATMPAEIAQLANSILTNPVKVEVTPASTTAETVQQELYFVSKTNKRHLLVHLLKTHQEIDRLLVFNRTKHGANKIVKDLVNAGIAAEAIHGNKSQNARQQALANFKNSQTRVLVATDIAARGIDIDELGFVLNYDLPNIPETYVHRIGRTGRAGASGLAISFCEAEERPFLRDIQKLIGKNVPVIADHQFVEGPGAPSHTVQEKEMVAHMHKAAQRRQPRGDRQGQRGGQRQQQPRQQRQPDSRQQQTGERQPVKLLKTQHEAGTPMENDTRQQTAAQPQPAAPRQDNPREARPQSAQNGSRQNAPATDNRQPRPERPKGPRPNKPELAMPKPRPVNNPVDSGNSSTQVPSVRPLFSDDDKW